MHTYLSPMAHDLAVLVLQIGLGIVIADLFSGVFHWWEDTYGNPEWPIIGPYVIEPNIWHHSEPLKFTRAPFWKRNRVVFVLAAMIASAFWLAGWINPTTVTALIFGSLANEIHVWTHVPKKKRPLPVRWLQNLGVFTTSKEHWKHHTQGFDKRYCTVTNILNPVLDGLRIFRIIEGLVEGLLGRRPRDEETGIAPFRQGRRALSRARRWVCALTWQIRRTILRPLAGQPYA